MGGLWDGYSEKYWCSANKGICSQCKHGPSCVQLDRFENLLMVLDLIKDIYYE